MTVIHLPLGVCVSGIWATQLAAFFELKLDCDFYFEKLNFTQTVSHSEHCKKAFLKKLSKSPLVKWWMVVLYNAPWSSHCIINENQRLRSDTQAFRCVRHSCEKARLLVPEGSEIHFSAESPSDKWCRRSDPSMSSSRLTQIWSEKTAVDSGSAHCNREGGKQIVEL